MSLGGSKREQALHSPSHETVWTATAKLPTYPPLSRNLHADVCVIGAGLTGLSVAYQLAREGQSVIVLDAGQPGAGATAVTTAHLSNALDTRYMEIERLHGGEGSRLAAESHTRAIAEIEAIVATESMECDFARLDGLLFAKPHDTTEVLENELQAAHRAGLKEVELVRHPPLAFLEGEPYLRFPEQAQFHPLKYLSGLARAITREGGLIFANTHVEHIEGGSKALVNAGEHQVTANSIVVATNTPMNDRFAIHTKQAPYLSYVIGSRVPGGSVRKALYWDTADPYHYVRLQRVPGSKHDLLIVGGEDHKTGQADDTEERHGRLFAWASTRFPMMGAIEFAWSGQVMETIDGLAFIGRNPLDHDNVYIATGDCGMGMTHGTIAGLLIRDLILGRENAWAGLYDPGRKTLRAASTFIRETGNVAAQYTHWLSKGDVASVDEIPRGSGAVVRRGLGKAAVYRDETGELHERSAACPHLGCMVDWNPTEKTWDCPCHGSRFDRLGKVLNGPANRDLAR